MPAVAVAVGAVDGSCPQVLGAGQAVGSGGKDHVGADVGWGAGLFFPGCGAVVGAGAAVGVALAISGGPPPRPTGMSSTGS